MNVRWGGLCLVFYNFMTQMSVCLGIQRAPAVLYPRLAIVLFDGLTQMLCATADFFYSMLNLRLPIALALMAAAYLISFLTWALIWHGVYWCATTASALLCPRSWLAPA